MHVLLLSALLNMIEAIYNDDYIDGDENCARQEFRLHTSPPEIDEGRNKIRPDSYSIVGQKKAVCNRVLIPVTVT
jgi:hypothetical protein